MDTTFTALAAHAKTVVHTLGIYGLSQSQLFEGLDLDPALMDDPDRRLPFAFELSLWRRAAELANDPWLGLELAKISQRGAWGPLGYIVSSCATFGEGVVQLTRYLDMVVEGIKCDIVVGEDTVVLRETVADLRAAQVLAPLYSRHQIEYEYALLVHLGRVATGSHWTAERVDFVHPRPADDIAPLTALFGPDVRFGASEGCLVFSRAIWDTPCAAPDPVLRAYMEQKTHALVTAMRTRTGEAGRLRTYLVNALPMGRASLQTAARQLGTAERTLRRRLSAENTSFQSVLEEVRQELALIYLGDVEMSLCDVAFSLGYSEQSAFQRAFRRWTGTSPGAFRQRAGA